VAQRLAELWPLAQGLLQARGAWCVVDAEAASRCGMPRPSGRVALGLCTIGAPLEEEAARRGAAGEALEALLLDAFGSAAAEATAEALAEQICHATRRTGLFPARRLSPGYGRWALAAQTTLFALLPHAAVGVRLSEGQMMIPRKSVSFAARLAVSATTARERRRCAACELGPRCAYRRPPAATDQEDR
jgi:hypothetical protein